MLAAGACSHAGPARASTVECRSVAQAQAIAGLNAGQACGLVRERTLAALAAHGFRHDVRIELDLSRRGSAVARVQVGGGGAEARALPEIAVDVMDRGLARGDLMRLADAIAGALVSN